MAPNQPISPQMIVGQQRPGYWFSKPKAAVIALFGFAVSILVLWFYFILRRPSHQHLPLRQSIDADTIQGVEHRFRTLDPAKGRNMLQRLGSTPAILIPDQSAWIVCTGQRLAVRPIPSTEPGAVFAEFTLAGRPRTLPYQKQLAPTPPEKDASVVTQPTAVDINSNLTMPTPRPVDRPIASAPPPLLTPTVVPSDLREIAGGNAVALGGIADVARIRFFLTLSAKVVYPIVENGGNGMQRVWVRTQSKNK